GADSPQRRHARADASAGGQHRRAESPVHHQARLDLDAGGEVSREASRAVQPGRGLRPVSYGTRGLGRCTDAHCARHPSASDAASKQQFGAVPAVRQLSGGKLLVNDIAKRQLTLLDPSLQMAVIVADSASGSPNSYGTAPGGLVAYTGDSTLFVDPVGLSMFV